MKKSVAIPLYVDSDKKLVFNYDNYKIEPFKIGKYTTICHRVLGKGKISFCTDDEQLLEINLLRSRIKEQIGPGVCIVKASNSHNNVLNIVGYKNKYYLGMMPDGSILELDSNELQDYLNSGNISGICIHKDSIRIITSLEYIPEKLKVPDRLKDRVDDNWCMIHKETNIENSTTENTEQTKLQFEIEDPNNTLGNISYIEFYNEVLANSHVGDILTIPKKVYDALRKEVKSMFASVYSDTYTKYKQVVQFKIVKNNNIYFIGTVIDYDSSKDYVRCYIMNKPFDTNSIETEFIERKFFEFRNKTRIV